MTDEYDEPQEEQNGVPEDEPAEETPVPVDEEGEPESVPEPDISEPLNVDPPVAEDQDDTMAVRPGATVLEHSPLKVDLDKAVAGIIALAKLRMDKDIRYKLAMSLFGAVGIILTKHKSQPVGRSISYFVDQLTAAGFGQLKLRDCLFTPRLTHEQAQQLSTLLLLFFDGRTEAGRAQIRKQLSMAKIQESVGDIYFRILSVWLS